MMSSIVDSPNFNLVDACKYGQLRECVAYVEKMRLQNPNMEIGPLINVTDENGNTPLHWAAYKRHHDIVKYLLSMGASPNISNSDESQTPLHWACIGGDSYVVKCMINSGGDPLQVDKRGYNSLIHSTQYNEINITRYLVERVCVPVSSADHLSQTALHWAAYQGHVHLLLYLVNKGADIYSVDSYGRTPLHWAAYKGHNDAAKALCDFGSNLNLKDNEGMTPTDLARQQNHTYLSRTLQIYPFHPFRKMGALKYNILWILISVGIYCSFAFSLYYFSFILSMLACVVIVGFCKLVIEPIVLQYTRNPLLPTWMLSSFTTWIIFYLKFIMQAFPNAILTHTVTLFILISYYYYAFKCFFSDPGSISPSSASQDAKDFIASVENETKLPDICSTCLINKPSRARHCRTCKRCVARFDHHCGWINNCVGVNNHLSFIILLILFTVSYTTSMIFNFKYLALDPESPSISSFGTWITYHYSINKALLVYMIYESFIMGWIGNLLYTQVRGVLTNVTMFEYMRPEGGGKCKHHGHGNNQDGANNNNNNTNNNNNNNGQQSGSSSDHNCHSHNKRQNKYDRGSYRENVREFIYESAKWFRYYNHKQV